MNQPPQHFTAARIAEALGKAPRIVRRWLSVIRPDGETVVRGNLASCWKLASLPEHVRQELNATAAARGFRNAEHLLSGENEVWQPEMPWNEICPEQQAEALVLQRALLPVIPRRSDTTISVADFELLGVQTYARETGKEISREKWSYIFARTIKRDAGANQFHRPELFLNGNLRRALPIAPARGDVSDFEPLNLCLSHFRNPAQPTGEEIDALWIETIELFSELREKKKPKKLKRRLLDFLGARAPFLAKSANALRVNFDRKFKAFETSDEKELALLDGRELKRGEQRAPELPQDDIDRIAWHSARNCGGRTAQAVRELASAGERSGLSPITLETISRPASRKSHVNRRVFAAVQPEVKAIAPYLLGKKAKDDATPSLQRDYSKLRTMDVLTADDFTMPVYMYVPDGKGWWTLTRGQCLLMIDVRSLKIIAFSLQPERSYNSFVIRTLMNTACRKWGLPRAWYFENGIWRNASLVKGAPREWSEGKSWGELKPGWAKLGVKFIHAKKARSKPAELVGGKLQNFMERMLGYCGRDERRYCPEETKRNKLAVEARRVEPQGLFLSFDAWETELEKLIETYNNDVQQGRILNGQSPEQAFEAFWPHDNQPTRFDASCWHLLAHYVSERTVGVDGITFKIGNQPFIYRDENSSDLRGQTVLAWFDPGCPELLGVTDKRGRNPRLIQRAGQVDFLASMEERESASGKQYQNELAKVAGHNAYPKARYRLLSTKFSPTFRKNLVAPGVAAVAETFAAAREKIQEKDRQKTERASTRVNRARKLGLQPSAVRVGDAAVDEGLEMMLRAERAEKSEAREYVLNPDKTFTPKQKGSAQ